MTSPLHQGQIAGTRWDPARYWQFGGQRLRPALELLTESIPVDERPNIQGTADLIMGMAGATAGLLAGVVVGLGSYGLLNGIATLLIVPLIALALRSGQRLTAASPAA